MYRINIKQKLASFMAIGALASVSAFAGPIVLGNASFETLPASGLPSTCGVGCSYDTGIIPSWNSTDPTNTGQFQPGPAAGNFTFFNAIPDGITIAYSNGPTISQTATPVQLGVTYTLLVDLGRRKDAPFTSSADLLINGNTVNAVGVAPTAGNFTTFTATYTGLAADVGKTITVELKSSGIQGAFDNVRLSDNSTQGSATPEPATASIFGMGLVAVLAYSRRKRSL